MASTHKSPNVLNVYKVQLIIQTNKVFDPILYTVSHFEFVNKRSITSEMSGIMELIYCKNNFSKLDVRDHKFLDVFEDGNCLFYQMALILHYKGHKGLYQKQPKRPPNL